MYNRSLLGLNLGMSTFSLLPHLSQSFSTMDLDALARKSGFMCRKARKITPRSFLLAVLTLASQGAMALRIQAQLIGWFSEQSVSKQAVRKRAQKGRDYLKSVLQQLLDQRLQSAQKTPVVFKMFNRVLLADSTTLALPAALASVFPGARNQCISARQSQLKIQCYYELLGDQMLHFELCSFRQNDQSASGHILPLCQPGDLVLRDLGYFVLDVFKQLAQRGCFFISRLRSNIALSDPATGKALDVLVELRGQSCLDRPVLMGRKLKLPVRLVAIKLPEEIAAKRRRQRKNNRDKRLRYTHRTKVLLGYEIFVTNLSAQQLDARQISSAYGLRWRIETLFKAFKQHLNLARISETTLYQLELLIYSRLLLITMLVNFVAGPIRAACSSLLNTPPLSIVKLLQWLALFMPAFILIDSVPKTRFLSRWARQIPKHCSYEKRVRLDFISCFQALS